MAPIPGEIEGHEPGNENREIELADDRFAHGQHLCEFGARRDVSIAECRDRSEAW